MHRGTRHLATLLFACFAAAVLAVPLRADFVRNQALDAFSAFSCAGTALREGRDPYLVEPLRSCERSAPNYARYGIDGAVEPAPLPGYAFAPFVPLSRLPFVPGLWLYTAAMIGATVVALLALVRLTGLSVPMVGSALLLADLLHNLVFAEIPPFVLAALAMTGLMLARERHWQAAMALGVALVEPHVALPAAIAVAIGVPKARVPLFAIGALLFGLTLAISGVGGMHEYFAQVLPLHARAELPASDQYSLSWLLHQLGASDAVALGWGAASYALMTLLGVLTALRLACESGEPAYLALVPPAMAMIGGSFLHDIQLPIAIPAALLLFARMPRERGMLLAALALLAVPWSAYGRLLAIAAPLTAAVLVAASEGLSPRNRLLGGASAALAVAAIFGGLQRLDARQFHPALHLPTTMASVGDDTENASAAWGRYVRLSGYGSSSFRSIGEKVPSELGLLLLSFTALASSRNGRGAAGRVR